jgi:drug/metabolite transporter (DMT)-like permease
MMLGLHLATWAWALQHATVANASLFLSMQPAITPLIGHWIAGDALNRREYAGTALACLGMIWILSGQVMFTRDQIPGSAVALLSMIFCAFYLVLGRRYRKGQHVMLFTVPVYLSAAVTQAVVALLATGRISVAAPAGTWLALGALILFPTVIGHTLAMYLLRPLKAHSIALSVPVQLVIISIAGGILFHEIPRLWFYPGAAAVMYGALLAVFAARAAHLPVPLDPSEV